MTVGQAEATVPVTVQNFTRAETDAYFASIVKRGGFGRLDHNREPVSIDHQDVIRMNRDTLYSGGVFDLEAGPVTIVLPDAGSRYMALLLINEDHFAPEVVYAPGSYSFTMEQLGTRYAAAIVRTLVDPESPEDLAAVHVLQDAIGVEQAVPGSFSIPDWDRASQKQVRDALLTLAGHQGSNPRGRFGWKGEVDPVIHLIGTASGWGGNPDQAASYNTVYPEANDGTTVHVLTVNDVPVDGFWSISVYNADGYFERNDLDAYSVNNLTARPNADGSVTVQFGGCRPGVPNCLPIVPGWNYTVRMYQPRKEVLDGTWVFPVAQPIG